MRIERTLLLNQGYQPLKIISWKRAMCMHILEKVEVLASYDWKVRSAFEAFPAPAVVRLTHATKTQPHRIRFSRTNIYSRDNKTCQYCGEKFHVKDLTLDHVIPRSMGGRTTWTNIVTACIGCNTGKANRTPQQASMRLIKQPIYPGVLGSYGKYLDSNRVPNEWHDWLSS